MRKELVEDGILHMMAAAAEQQQRRDFGAAHMFYESAMQKAVDAGITRQKLLTGTVGKPAPLNAHTAIEWSLLTGDLESAILLKGSANALLETFASASPLDAESISTLISEKGADVNLRVGTTPRWTLLHAAAHAGDLDMVERLLGLGALVDCLDDRGATALHWAAGCKSGQAAEIVKRLLAAEFKARARDGDGQSVIQAALSQGTPATVVALADALKPLTEADRKELAAWSHSVVQVTHDADNLVRLQGIFDALGSAGITLVPALKLALKATPAPAAAAPATRAKQTARPEVVVTNKANGVGFVIDLHIKNFAQRYAKDQKVLITFKARNRTWRYEVEPDGIYLRLTSGNPIKLVYSAQYGAKTFTTSSRQYSASTNTDSWGYANHKIPHYQTLEFADSPLLKNGVFSVRLDCTFS